MQRFHEPAPGWAILDQVTGLLCGPYSSRLAAEVDLASTFRAGNDARLHFAVVPVAVTLCPAPDAVPDAQLTIFEEEATCDLVER